MELTNQILDKSFTKEMNLRKKCLLKFQNREEKVKL